MVLALLQPMFYVRRDLELYFFILGVFFSRVSDQENFWTQWLGNDPPR